MTSASVVVVDDETASRAVLQHVLEVVGLDVTLARSGEEGLNLIRSQVPDLVLTDIRMPGMGGIAMVSRARTEQGEDCPLMVAVTSHPEDVGDREIFDLVLKKPVSPSHLYRWLRSHGLARS